MKKIIGGISISAAMTALLLATASAGDVVVNDISNGTMTPSQANTFFGAYASARCPASAATVQNIRLVRCDDGDTQQYCDSCIVQVSLSVSQAATKMQAADADDTLTVAIVAKDGESDNVLVRGERRGIMTATQANTWFGSYVASGCNGLSASLVQTIGVSKGDGEFSHRCKGLTTMTIEAARDALPVNSDAHKIEIVGLVTTE